jgi:hypothetical protein
MHLLAPVVAGVGAAAHAVALPVTWMNNAYEEEDSVAALVARAPGAVSRARFMVGVLGGVGTVIGLVYAGAILR